MLFPILSFSVSNCLEGRLQGGDQILIRHAMLILNLPAADADRPDTGSGRKIATDHAHRLADAGIFKVIETTGVVAELRFLRDSHCESSGLRGEYEQA